MAQCRHVTVPPPTAHLRPPPRDRISGSVRTFAWTNQEEQAQACSLLRAHAAGAGSEPLLIKGVAGSWPAVGKWTLQWLAAQHGCQRWDAGLHSACLSPACAASPQCCQGKDHRLRRVGVRLSPTPRVTFVEPKLLPLFLAFRPAAAAPSLLAAGMPLAEFAARLCGRLPPLVYRAAPREFCYLQTPLWPALLPDVDLAGPPFSSVEQPGARGAQLWPGGGSGAALESSSGPRCTGRRLPVRCEGLHL